MEEARAAIRQVEMMPLAREVAAEELHEARAALSYAELSAGKHDSAGEISNAILLAKRHAEIAAQQIALEQAKRTVESAEREWQARAHESGDGADDAATWQDASSRSKLPGVGTHEHSHNRS